MIDIYTQPSCTWCDMVKSLFTKSGLIENEDYKFRDIVESEEDCKFIVNVLGAKSVPVVVSNGTVIMGYKPVAIAEVINERIRDNDALEWAGVDENGRWLH